MKNLLMTIVGMLLCSFVLAQAYQVQDTTIEVIPIEFKILNNYSNKNDIIVYIITDLDIPAAIQKKYYNYFGDKDKVFIQLESFQKFFNYGIGYNVNNKISMEYRRNYINPSILQVYQRGHIITPTSVLLTYNF